MTNLEDLPIGSPRWYRALELLKRTAEADKLDKPESRRVTPPAEPEPVPDEASSNRGWQEIDRIPVETVLNFERNDT